MLNDLSRRQFVESIAAASFGVSVLPDVLNGASVGKAKNVIYLFMDGGMTHIDTFDPKPGTDTGGETKAIKTNVDGIQISEFLPSLAKMADKFAIIRSMTSKQGEHDRAKYLMRTSYNKIATIKHPSLGAWLMKIQGKNNETLPGFVVVAGPANHPSSGFMDGKYSALSIGDPAAGLQNSRISNGVTEKQFNERLNLASAFDSTFRSSVKTKDSQSYADFYNDAIRLMKSEDLKAFDISQETKEVRDRYGSDRFGQGVLLARRLVEHGVRFVEVNLGGFDMHYQLWDNIEAKAANLDKALSALLSDLSSKGLLKDTLVVLGTDFGRTPKINDRGGRDHHPRVFSVITAGAGVKGGTVVGSSDEKGFAPKDNPVTVEDYNATIAHLVGLPLDKQVFSPSGRPFTVANKGQVIKEIIA